MTGLQLKAKGPASGYVRLPGRQRIPMGQLVLIYDPVKQTNLLLFVWSALSRPNLTLVFRWMPEIFSFSQLNRESLFDTSVFG